jgi:enterochelin esterase-like enzyme
MFQLFQKNNQASKRQFIVILFGVFFIGQLFWLAMPYNSSGHATPRMQQAIESHKQDSQEMQMAAMAEAGRLDMIDYHRREVAKYSVLLGVDIVVIYLFWKYGKRYTAA